MSRKWNLKDSTKSEEIIKSYMTKEEFINLISSINFTHIESAEIELITGFYLDFSAEDETVLSALGSKITLF